MGIAGVTMGLLQMRYIGSKTLLTDAILAAVSEKARGAETVLDIFAGTGAVGRVLKENGYGVMANDQLYFSYVLNRGTLEPNEPPSPEMKELIEYLNHLSPDSSRMDMETAFIYQNYSPHKGCERMYFQGKNALKIDLIRQETERLRSELTETEYFYLLSLLIRAVPYVSNITGTYGAYLKYWDKRTYNDLTLVPEDIIVSSRDCQCFNDDALRLARRLPQVDLAYLDPPYNQRQYLPNYHVLETIARYDYPEIHGVTGVRNALEMSSDFCKKRKVATAFRELIEALNCRYVLVSYNNEGLLPTEQLSEIVRSCGRPETFMFREIDYRRYKNKIPNNRPGLKEQLYFIEK